MNVKRPGRTNRTVLDVALVLAVLLSGMSCGRSEKQPEVIPSITRLHPPEVVAGKRFQVQANGQSAIAVVGSNFVKGCTILFDGRPLETTYGSSKLVTGLVPDEYLSRPRKIEVRVANQDGQVSDPALFPVVAEE